MDRPGGREVADKADPRALEAFVRALVGVRQAVVEFGRNGRPETIWVVPAPGVPERQVRLNIISALMAGPGLAMDPAALRVVSALPDPDQPATPTATPDPTPAAPPIVIGRVNGSNGAHASETNGTNGTKIANGNAALVRLNGTAAQLPSDGNGGPDSEAALPSPDGPLRLVRFELESPCAGRLRVVVGVESRGRSGLGVREGDDRPGSAIDLAAKAAADAARATGATAGAFQLAGVVLTDVAGRTHVVAAVDMWTGRDFAARPGAAAVLASYEEAAARAVLAALSRY